MDKIVVNRIKELFHYMNTCTVDKNELKVKSLNDMTVGSPFKILWNFSIPMLISVMFQQLYSIIDSIIAGKYIGVDALAAVGASYPITVLFIAVATGASIGCSVVVSQIFGAKKYTKMKSAISTAIISIIVLSIILTIIGFIICNPIMSLMNTPKNILSNSELFLRIYILGVSFLFTYNTANAIFNALGDSKTPLYFLMFSSLFNIVLDIVFVVVLHMGIAGVAWPTFIAQGISSILAMGCLIYRIRKIEVIGKYKRFDIELLKHMSTIAIPSIMQQSFISVGQLCVQGLINSYGDIVVAGYSAAFRINTFIITSITTMSSALSTFTAQNMGAKKLKRVRKGYKSLLVMMLILYSIVSLIILIFGKNLISLFVDVSKGKMVINVGLAFLCTVTPFYVVVVIKTITDGVLRGAGDMKEFMTTTFMDLFLRVIFSFVLAKILGYAGIWWAFPVGWTIGCIFSVYYYFKGKWKSSFLL
ncbi:MATE family efflux transporter [Clostridium acidisoli]|nr:MATE family efflux transporter [Clostridium acidisoli]